MPKILCPLALDFALFVPKVPIFLSPVPQSATAACESVIGYLIHSTFPKLTFSPDQSSEFPRSLKVFACAKQIDLSAKLIHLAWIALIAFNYDFAAISNCSALAMEWWDSQERIVIDQLLALIRLTGPEVVRNFAALTLHCSLPISTLGAANFPGLWALWPQIETCPSQFR